MYVYLLAACDVFILLLVGLIFLHFNKRIKLLNKYLLDMISPSSPEEFPRPDPEYHDPEEFPRPVPFSNKFQRPVSLSNDNSLYY